VGLRVSYPVPALHLYRLAHFTPATYSRIFHYHILHVFSPTVSHSHILPTPDQKAFFIVSCKRKYLRKWNSIYGRKWNKNEKGHSFSAEKRKQKSPDNISVFFFFIHSVTMRLPIPRPVSPFFAGGPCWWDSTFLSV